MNKENRIENIEVNVDKAKDKALFTQYDYIKLETSDDCLLPSSLNKILSYKDTLIIHSIENNNILSFKKDGKFIKRFSIGNGPNEIIYPVDITFDNINKTLWVLDSYRFVKEFTLAGVQQNEIKVKNPYMRVGRFHNTTLLFDANLGKKNDYYFEFVNDTTSNKYANKKEHFKEIVYLPNSTFNIINDSTVCFYHQFDDKIYSWTPNSPAITPIYQFSFTNAKSIASLEPEIPLKSKEYQKLYNNREYIFGIKNLYIRNDNVFFTIETDKLLYCLYNSHTKKLSICNHLLEGLPDPRNIIGLDENHLLYALTPDELLTYSQENPLSEKISRIINGMKEDDNPIIVRCRIA